VTSDATIAKVGHPAPEFLRIDGLGAGLRGTIAPATVVIREEFLPSEWSAFESGRYEVGVKLYNRDQVVGLVLELNSPGSRMQFYLNYSLAHLDAVGGAAAVEQVVETLHAYKREREPGLGLLVFLVFLGLDELQTVRGLRAFVLPRMFGDRFLEAVLRTTEQDLDIANERVVELCGNTQTAWEKALPGVAVAGHELELSEGDYVRLRKRSRTRGR
jgi:hypothetical protein